MGSSTRNSYKRSDKIIKEGIEDGKVNEQGAGIGELLAKLLFPKKGQSKIKATLNENLYSKECTNSIKNIIKISKAVNSGILSSIGLGGLSRYSNIELKEKVCDYLGISNNELLKTSLKETLEKNNIFDKSLNIIRFITQYVKNIISNIYKQFTYEDALNSLEKFDSEEYSNSINYYMEEKVVPIIQVEFEEIEFTDDILEQEDTFASKVNNAFSNIIKKLRGDVEYE